MANREAGLAMSLGLLFRWASLTKVVTSVAALALEHAGQIRLDDPVTRFLPYFRPALASGEIPTISIRHLLTHTSGLGYAFAEQSGGPYHAAGSPMASINPGYRSSRI